MTQVRNNSYITAEQFDNILLESKRQTQVLFSSIIDDFEDARFINCINEAVLDINQSLLNYVDDLIQLNRKDELLDNLSRYFDNCTESKVDYETNKLGFRTNSLSGANREQQLIAVEDYFTFCLYRLFYLELIPKISVENSTSQPINKSPFSVLEWATIFYYADETKLLTESRLIKTRLEQFMSKHQVNTTPVNFKNSYYEAKRRINEKKDYPINKLELIIPFLKENYKQTVTKVENDIIFLEENTPEH